MSAAAATSTAISYPQYDEKVHELTIRGADRTAVASREYFVQQLKRTAALLEFQRMSQLQNLFSIFYRLEIFYHPSNWIYFLNMNL